MPICPNCGTEMLETTSVRVHGSSCCPTCGYTE